MTEESISVEEPAAPPYGAGITPDDLEPEPDEDEVEAAEREFDELGHYGA